MNANVRRYISVADHEAINYQNSNNLNTRTNDQKSTEAAIEYTVLWLVFIKI